MPVFVVLILGMVALRVLSENRKAELRARTPEIVHGRLLKTPRRVGRVMPEGPSLLVALPDETLRYIPVRDSDYRGCEVGDRVTLERRGTSHRFAPIVCPDARVHRK